jgi:hypothetical protein
MVLRAFHAPAVGRPLCFILPDIQLLLEMGSSYLSPRLLLRGGHVWYRRVQGLSCSCEAWRKGCSDCVPAPVR